MTSDPFLINGLPLPAALAAAIKNGTWRTPVDREVWRSLFPPSAVALPLLYGLDAMRRETAALASPVGRYPGYTGAFATQRNPGDLDLNRAVLIGDLEPDVAIALDYRVSMDNPSVVYLTGEDDLGWVKVASDIETFIRALKLDVADPQK